MLNRCVGLVLNASVQRMLRVRYRITQARPGRVPGPRIMVRPFAAPMTFSIYTHDAWGVVPVGDFATLEQARGVFASICADPWYRQDGTVKGVELVQRSAEGGASQRLDWFAFQ